ncbi:helix-turn-helix domain-containing protein [Candidatus Woesearchaeota archaeon]|nr:MAG: helix-turn-helix domain-containing protein [Candidatus Woesearchaeota archaeon]
MKKDLLEKASIFLLRKGYTVKTLTRTCFDIVARKDEVILLINILEDANGITNEAADEMRRLSSWLKASPIIIAEKAGEPLLDNVVYSRFGIYAVNLTTFKNCEERKFPFVMRSKAGLTAHLIGNKMREKRQELDISLNTLAKRLGVSRRMVAKYESGNSEILVNKAERLYDIIGSSVFERINIFKVPSQEMTSVKSDITKKFDDLGFNSTQTKKVPFSVIAKKKKELVFTEVGDKTSPNLPALSKLLEADSLVIFKKKKPKNIPALTKEEFFEFEKANELIKFLKEFE